MNNNKPCHQFYIRYPTPQEIFSKITRHERFSYAATCRDRNGNPFACNWGLSPDIEGYGHAVVHNFHGTGHPRYPIATLTSPDDPVFIYIILLLIQWALWQGINVETTKKESHKCLAKNPAKQVSFSLII